MHFLTRRFFAGMRIQKDVLILKKGGIQTLKKRTLVVIVSIFIFLITASIVGAKAKYETKPVPKGERHHISEIIHSKG